MVKNDRQTFILQALREKIQTIEWCKNPSLPAISVGVMAIDRALPWQGLPSGCVHEVVGQTEGPAIGFLIKILAHMAKQRGPILWCSAKPNLYTPGLMQFGLRPQDIIFVQAKQNKEALWTLEEGLRTRALGAVIGERVKLNMSSTKRLQLAAMQSGVTAFLLSHVADLHVPSTVAMTRWKISPLLSAQSFYFWKKPSVGAARFSIELQRCRGGNVPMRWSVEWNESTFSFGLVSQDFEEQRRVA